MKRALGWVLGGLGFSVGVYWLVGGAVARHEAPANGLPLASGITYRFLKPGEVGPLANAKVLMLFADVDGHALPFQLLANGRAVTVGTPQATLALTVVRDAFNARWRTLNARTPQKNWDAGDANSTRRFWVPMCAAAGVGKFDASLCGHAAIPVDEFGRSYPGTYGGGSKFNPIGTFAQAAEMVLPFIPGIGTGASAAIGFAVALGQGASVQDAAVAGARAAIPPGPGRIAFDAGVGVAIEGKPLSQVAQDALFAQYPEAKAYYQQGQAIAAEVRQ